MRHDGSTGHDDGSEMLTWSAVAKAMRWHTEDHHFESHARLGVPLRASEAILEIAGDERNET